MTGSSFSITLDSVISESIGILLPVFPKTAREETYKVIADCLSTSPPTIRINRDRMTVTHEQKKEIIEKTVRRANREPLQYIAECAWFMGEPFRIGKGVLIPRSDTEILVEEALRIAKETLLPSVSSVSSVPSISSVFSSSAPSKEFRFFEFCTGSGCIALSFLKKMRDAGLAAKGVATDISPEALGYAAENARRFDCADRIRLVEWDMFADQIPLTEEKHPEKYAMILANPPYIRSDIIATLEPEVSLFEPAIALDGGPDGLRFYRRILDCAEDLLAPDGWILLEIGYDQEQEVRALVEKTGRFGQISSIRDYGGNFRVVIAKKKGCESNS